MWRYPEPSYVIITTESKNSIVSLHYRVDYTDPDPVIEIMYASDAFVFNPLTLEMDI